MPHHSEETKTCILQAAQALFARNGYDATGVAEICAAAGVSKGAFYHHFPTKQAVFLNLLEDWLAALDRQMEPLLHGIKDVPDNLVQTAGIVSTVFDSASGQLPMFLEFWRASSHDPKVWETTMGPLRRYQELFSGIIRQGIAEGTLKPVDADTTARVIIALALGMIIQGIMDPNGAAWNQTTQDGMKLLFTGLSK